MKKSKKIYVVTDGEYSDYHIIGIYSRKDYAEALIEAVGNGEIEIWSIDETKLEIRGRKQYFVRMKRNGDTEEVYIDDSFSPYFLPTYGFDMDGSLYNRCLAKDEQHAVKITNELRAKLIAKNEWGKDNILILPK